MCAISLQDTLTLRPAKRDAFAVRPEGAAPLDASNTVWKALAALRRRVKVPPVRIELVKRIPSGAGLGGGSSDAAGLVRAANRLFGLGLTVDAQRAVLAEVGSDTAFFATGGLALCTGRGEIVAPLPDLPRPLDVVLVSPPVANPTREIYARLKLNLTRRPRNVTRFLNSLSTGDPDLIGKSLFNRLETPAFEFRPELLGIRRALGALPFAGVLMTGSGSTMFGICRTGARGGEREVRRQGWGRTVRVRSVPAIVR
jgi:4-diphosphocytidyl-2-C-methyl-D-erythritol kinase